METSVGKSVFILTDAFNDYNNLNNLLRVEGHSVVYLSNSINAVQQIIENVPDFILCDFHLKNPISLEILQTLQKIDFTASIPFVLIGSPIKQQEILDLILLGAQNYIVKPFETHYLFLLIKREFKKREYIANSLIQKYQVFYHNPFDGFIILHDYQFFFAMILSLKCWGLKRMNCQNSPLKI